MSTHARSESSLAAPCPTCKTQVILESQGRCASCQNALNATRLRVADIPDEHIAARLACLHTLAANANPYWNYERSALEEVAEALARGDVRGAQLAADRGLVHAFRERFTEDRPETWLLVALRSFLPRKLAPLAHRTDARAMQ